MTRRVAGALCVSSPTASLSHALKSFSAYLRRAMARSCASSTRPRRCPRGAHLQPRVVGDPTWYSNLIRRPARAQSRARRAASCGRSRGPNFLRAPRRLVRRCPFGSHGSCESARIRASKMPPHLQPSRRCWISGSMARRRMSTFRSPRSPAVPRARRRRRRWRWLRPQARPRRQQQGPRRACRRCEPRRTMAQKQSYPIRT